MKQIVDCSPGKLALAAEMIAGLLSFGSSQVIYNADGIPMRESQSGRVPVTPRWLEFEIGRRFTCRKLTKTGDIVAVDAPGRLVRMAFEALDCFRTIIPKTGADLANKQQKTEAVVKTAPARGVFLV
ncbi:hypothetical protein CCP4SC76_2490010 [Gammaproteobacteria bacterium]